MSVGLMWLCWVMGMTFCVVFGNYLMNRGEKTEGVGGFFMFLAILGLIGTICYPIVVTAHAYSYSLTYDKPDAIIRTNYITSIIYELPRH